METKIYKAEYIEANFIREEWEVNIGDVISVNKISRKCTQLSPITPCWECKYFEGTKHRCELFDSWIDKDGFCSWGRAKDPDFAND